MTILVVCALMSLGTVVPAIWLGFWDRNSAKSSERMLWVASALLAPILPLAAMASEPTNITLMIWLGGVSCAAILGLWWVCFDRLFRRILDHDEHALPERGSTHGFALSLLYPTIIATLHLRPTSWATFASGVIWVLYFILFGRWVGLSYKTLVGRIQNLGDRDAKDRMIGALYIMYVGQGGAVAVGGAGLFFDQGPLDLPRLWLATWPVVVAFLVGVTVLWVALHYARWRAPCLFASATAAIVSVSWFIAVNMPPINWYAGLIAGFAALALFTSVLWNGFLHHRRSPPVTAVIATSLATLLSVAVLYCILTAIIGHLSRYGRDEVGTLFAVAVLGWFFYGMAASVIALPLGAHISTDNGPVFNVWHDSIHVTGAILLGLIPIAFVARAGMPAGIESWVTTGSLVLAVLGALGLLLMGIKQGYLHWKSQPPHGPHMLGPRMALHWTFLSLIVLIGWALPALMAAG